MGLGDLAASLTIDTRSWTEGFAEANSVLDSFSARADSTLVAIVEGSRNVAVLANSAALSLGSMAVGLTAVGGSGGALLSVSRALLGIGGIANNLRTAITNLRSGTTYTQKIIGSIGAIGAVAGIATIALRGISLVMQRYDKDTTKIDAIGKSLGRVALAATVTIAGIQGIGLAVRTMRAAAITGIGLVAAGFASLKKSVALLPSTIGAVTTALGRMGASGISAVRSGAAAFGQFAVHAGDALGKVGQGMASIVTGFAFGGVLGALATAAGLLVSSGASMESLGLAGTAAAAPLERIRAGLGGVAAWLQKIGSGVATAGLTALGEMAQRGQRYFDAFLAAIQPLTDAIQNVWLPAVIGSTEGANSAFASFFDYVETTWGTWIQDSISALAEFIGNFDLYFQIAQQSIVLFAANSLVRIGDFFNNIGIWLDWFGQNWSDVLFTASDLAATVFINIGQNIRDLFQSIWDWVSSGFAYDLEIDFTPLTEGFSNQIRKWPDLLQTELEGTSPELEALYNQLGERQAAAKMRGQAIERTAATSEEKAADKSSSRAAAENTAALQGSSAAAKILLAGVGGAAGNKQDALIQQQTKATLQMAGNLERGLQIRVEEVTLS